MAKPFSALPSALDGRLSEINGLVNRIMRAGATGVSNYVTAETPVKTGAARSNWVGTLDAAFEGVIPPYHPLPDLGHGAAPITHKQETENLSSARAQNQSAIQRYDFRRNLALILRNNIGYIGELNAGASAQTAAGFVKRAVEQFGPAVRGLWKLRP